MGFFGIMLTSGGSDMRKHMIRLLAVVACGIFLGTVACTFETASEDAGAPAIEPSAEAVPAEQPAAEAAEPAAE